MTYTRCWICGTEDYCIEDDGEVVCPACLEDRIRNREIN